MRLLCCGGRDFNDIEFAATILNRIHLYQQVTTLIAGGARGADTISEAWADEMGIEKEIYPVTSEDWRKYGKRAGILRNEQMLKEGKPDGVMAFPGGKGTANMVKISEGVSSRQIEVWRSKWVYFKKEDPETGFLSNFAGSLGFVDDGDTEWQTTEHYYAAHKTPIPSERVYVREAKTAAQAKKRGREINIYDDWNSRKDDVMRKALAYKFSPGTEAAKLLLATSIDYLVEYAPWGDVYWGVNKNLEGKNMLGKLLMERREQLR